VKGRTAVQAGLERNVDQVQQIHDQTIRLIGQGLDARQAAEAIAMSPSLRDGAELYGQVESHVRQVWNAERGWFGSDVYDINPLAVRDEAERTIAAMGGAATVRQQATAAATAGDIDNWRWALRLTSLLLTVDPADSAARAARATAARAMGQHTISANARGFYITEALQMENRLLAPTGQPVTIDLLRRSLGTPTKAQLEAAPVPQLLDYLRYLVDPAKAGTQRFDFTLSVAGDPAVYRVQLRNGVLVTRTVAAPAAPHIALSRAQLADLVLGNAPLPGNVAGIAGFEGVFDRSQFLSREMIAAKLAGANHPE
jgi:alkyl sulfatase BDS1-like metallo-beta-lactamase superfamily hydrolase